MWVRIVWWKSSATKDVDPGSCPTCLNHVYTNKPVTIHPTVHVFFFFHIRRTEFFSLQVLGYADYAFTSIFTVEILLKVPVNQSINSFCNNFKLIK